MKVTLSNKPKRKKFIDPLKDKHSVFNFEDDSATFRINHHKKNR